MELFGLFYQHIVLFFLIEEAAIQLSKYLLKTVCSDLINIVVLYLAEDLGIVSRGLNELSIKVFHRFQIPQKCSDLLCNSL